MKNHKSVVFFGCKSVTKEAMTFFINEISSIDYLVTISPKMAKSNKVAGYEDLTDFAHENNIKCYIANSYTLKDEKDIEMISSFGINIGITIGWQRLIPGKILKKAKIGIFGMHGSSDNLPRGRGRSPLNWSLILNKKEFHTNLIKYEDNIDGGSVVFSNCFDINAEDTIETLHFKNLLSLNLILKENFQDIIDGKVKMYEQDEVSATYYPKREPDDGGIDWNLSTQHILNFSRALTFPFPGSYTFLEGQKIMIWRMSEFSKTFSYSNSSPGEILEVFYNKKFLVKTEDSTIIVHKYDVQNSEIITKGKLFDSFSFRQSFSEIEKRYPNFVKSNQMEVTLEDIEYFYNKI